MTQRDRDRLIALKKAKKGLITQRQAAAAVYFGANSVASALNLPQERDLPKNHSHSNPNLSTSPPKQDISTLRRHGKYYSNSNGCVPGEELAVHGAGRYLRRVLRIRLRRLLLRIHRVLLVRALEVFDASALEMPDPRGHFLDQVLIVRHQQHGPRVLLKGDIEGVDRLQVQVIGGFVQHQEIRLLEHQPAKDQPRRLTAGESIGGFEGVLAAEKHLAERSE